ncbi:peptide chain release factor N(5)-glutamine methyltransferase [Patescibacteria group bacterium]|nr:peptide chain release factor N(5)-glutamine methyltransferase [Patescibacteria group bacterium]MBU4162116.1 peptide chain release factor N(5)-glutamine methyltransferase [Patescibacteria group bacterium]
MNKSQAFFEKQINWLLKEKYKGKLTAGAKKDIEKLKKGEPLDYIIGFVEFLGVKIDLRKKPLIPRQETEFWTEGAIKEIKNEKKGLECLDLFSGSGAIGIAVLKHIPTAQVDFGEINKDFLWQIRFNIQLNGFNKNRASIIETDIFKNITKQYDYIFANPPYIAKERKAKAQKSVLKYEPKIALLAGKDGLLYIKKFLKQAKKYLKPDGKIYLEFDSFQKARISALLKEHGYQNFVFFKDQYNHWRYAEISIL